MQGRCYTKELGNVIDSDIILRKNESKYIAHLYGLLQEKVLITEINNTITASALNDYGISLHLLAYLRMLSEGAFSVYGNGRLGSVIFLNEFIKGNVTDSFFGDVSLNLQEFARAEMYNSFGIQDGLLLNLNQFAKAKDIYVAPSVEGGVDSVPYLSFEDTVYSVSAMGGENLGILLPIASSVSVKQMWSFSLTDVSMDLDASVKGEGCKSFVTDIPISQAAAVTPSNETYSALDVATFDPGRNTEDIQDFTIEEIQDLTIEGLISKTPTKHGFSIIVKKPRKIEEIQELLIEDIQDCTIDELCWILEY